MNYMHSTVSIHSPMKSTVTAMKTRMSLFKTNTNRKKRNIRKGFKLIQNLEETFLSVTSPAGYSRVSLSNTRKKKSQPKFFLGIFCYITYC